MFDSIATLFTCELLGLGEVTFKDIARDVSKLGFLLSGILLTEPQAKKKSKKLTSFFVSHGWSDLYGQAQKSPNISTISENSN